MQTKPKIKPKPFGKHYHNAMIEHAIARSLSKRERAVLNVLLSHINYESGQSRPGRKAIKLQSGYTSDRSIDRSLKFLRDNGIIVPLAYLTGGRGWATCYGFCLPAWAGLTPADGAGVSHDPFDTNPRKPVSKPPQSSQQTPANGADPTERTERTGRDIAPAGRGAVPDAPDGGCTVAPVSPTADLPKRSMLAGETAHQAVARWDREDKEAAAQRA